MYANKQVAKFIKQSLGNFPLPRLVQKKNRPKKKIAVRWSVKYFLLQIPRYSTKVAAKKKKKEKKAIIKCYVFQANAINEEEREKGNHKVLCFSSKRN